MELIINFSGGKDSSAMLAYLCENYPDIKKHVVFADTGWEHKDAEAWCRKIVGIFCLPLNVVKSKTKTFLSMVEQRGMFPGMGQRQCTSDLKRDPINTWIRRKTNQDIIINCSNEIPVIINCLGLRSEESEGRKKHPKLRRNKRETNSKRIVWDWLPIKDWTEKEVLSYLKERNIPLHPVYNHLRRFSCRMCIYMTQHDISQVKKYDPEAFDIIAKLERKINFSMFNGMFLDNRPDHYLFFKPKNQNKK